MQDSFDFDFDSADHPEPFPADLIDAPWLRSVLPDLGLPEAGIVMKTAEPALVAVKPDFERDRPWPRFGAVQ